MFSRRWTRAFLLGQSLLVVACAEKGKTVHNHEPKKLAASQSVSGRGAGAGTLLARDANLEANAVDLAKRVLSTARRTNPKERAAPEARAELERLNQLLVERKLSSQDEAAILKLYLAALQSGCGLSLRRCDSLDYFEQSAWSVSVVLLLLKSQTLESRAYFDLLFIGMRLLKDREHPELVTLFTARAKEHLIYLNQSGAPGEAAAFADLAMTVSQTSLRKLRADSVQNVLRAIDPLSLQTRQLFRRSGVSLESWFSLMGQVGGLYSGHEFSLELSRELRDWRVDPQGFVVRLKEMTAKFPDASQSLGFEGTHEGGPSGDFIPWLLDQVWRREISASEGVALGRGFRVTREAIAKSVRNYLQGQFLYHVIHASQVAQEKFFAEQKSSTDMIARIFSASHNVIPIWEEFQSRASEIRLLSMQLLGQMERNDLIAEDTKRLFDAIPTNIKYFSTYPHMMAVAYYLSQRRMEYKIATWYRTYTFTAADVMQDLYLGQYGPWFRYSVDSQPLTMTELLYAFDFAVRSGTFEAFRIDPVDLIADVQKRMQRDFDEFTKSYAERIIRVTSMTDYQDLVRVCRDLRENRPLRRRVSLDDLRSSPLQGKFGGFFWYRPFGSEDAIMPMYGPTAGVATRLPGMFLADTLSAEAVERVRLDGAALERMILAMRAAVTKELRPDQQQLQRDLDRQTRLKTAMVLGLSLGHYDQVKDCHIRLEMADRRLQRSLLETESRYLRQVHRDLRRLRRGSKTLSSPMRFQGLPSGFQGYDQLTTDGYRMSSVDFLLRLREYLLKGLRTEEGTWGPVLPSLDVDFGADLSEDSEAVRFSTRSFVPFVEDENEFVAQGIRTLFSGAQSLRWFNYINNQAIQSTVGLVAFLSGWHRMGPKEVLPLRCAREACSEKDLVLSRRVEVSEVLSAHEHFMELARITPEERNFFELAGSRGRLFPGNFRMIFWSISGSQIANFFGLYDFPLDQLTQDVLGAAVDARMTIATAAESHDYVANAMANRDLALHRGYLQIGREYFLARRNENRRVFLASVSERVDRILDETVNQFLRQELAAIGGVRDRFHDYAGQLKHRPAEEQPRVDVDLREVHRGPVASDLVFTNVQSRLSQFHQDTNWCFDPTRGQCPDFGPGLQRGN